MIQKICEYCKKEYKVRDKARSEQRKYCGKLCRLRAEGALFIPCNFCDQISPILKGAADEWSDNFGFRCVHCYNYNLLIPKRLRKKLVYG